MSAGDVLSQGLRSGRDGQASLDSYPLENAPFEQQPTEQYQQNTNGRDYELDDLALPCNCRTLKSQAFLDGGVRSLQLSLRNFEMLLLRFQRPALVLFNARKQLNDSVVLTHEPCLF